MEPPSFHQGSAAHSGYGGESSEGEGSARGLKEWWGRFKVGNHTGKEPLGASKEGPSNKDSESQLKNKPVFAMPLSEAITYASITISTPAPDGEYYVWGVVPTVVARCGRYLKETATEVEGTFRVSGSSKRMAEIQAIFDSPPKYGKNIDWEQVHHTTHDVATIFRRFLTQMPEPVIPDSFYQDFRNTYSSQSHTPDVALKTYLELVERLPIPNKYLLLYVLDLLSVFEKISEKNLMNAANLAVIFQPGILSHPDHHLIPAEHALNQKVVEFLILHQGEGFASLLVPRLVKNPYRTESNMATSSTKSVPLRPVSPPKPKQVVTRPPIPLATRLSDIFTASDSDEDFEGGVVVKTNVPFYNTHTLLTRSKTTAGAGGTKRVPSGSHRSKQQGGTTSTEGGAGGSKSRIKMATKDDLATTTKALSGGMMKDNSINPSGPSYSTPSGPLVTCSSLILPPSSVVQTIILAQLAYEKNTDFLVLDFTFHLSLYLPSLT
ncbi:Rho GTPase-activating protein [Phaffia rhodozyma]|uniref:Rho GTPase-activating protein n=1 Tax=Phaffia rhodozyma TaxID=264483 RepID=A0A0F7SIB0_PHARH|nr:Rho GTPase-activating protein [Phaffia rhodozyma]